MGEGYGPIGGIFLTDFVLVESEGAELTPEGDWRVDPTGRHQYRYWDGEWTERVSDFGVRSEDPYTGSVIADTGLPPQYAYRARLETNDRSDRVRLDGERRRGPTSSPIKTIGGLAVVVGALLTGIGTLVPVLDHSSYDNTNYIDLPGNYGGHGLWVGFMAVLIALVAMFGILRSQSTRLPAVVTLLISVPLVALAYSDWHDIDDAYSKFGAPGLGLWSGLSLCLIGSVLVVAGSVLALFGQRS
jgi:hypothetical protein